MILDHYTDDFSIESPMALRIVPESKGFNSGKENIRAYWEIGVQRNPQLKFELINVLIRTNRLTLYYSNASANQKSDEIFHFNKNFQANEEVINYSE